MFSASRLRRLRRSSAALIAILAMVLHALMPTLAYAHGGSGSKLVEVCSTLGITKVVLSGDSIPLAPADSGHQQHCPLCAFNAASALPPATLTIFFSALQAAAPPAPKAVHSPAPTVLLPAPRGPPLVC